MQKSTLMVVASIDGLSEFGYIYMWGVQDFHKLQNANDKKICVRVWFQREIS